jgi:hypothetical protein
MTDESLDCGDQPLKPLPPATFEFVAKPLFDEMLATLKELEWSGPERLYEVGGSNRLSTECPVCYSARHEGHGPDCRLSALIAKAEGNVR